MKSQALVILLLCSLSGGACWYAIQHRWIIIRIPALWNRAPHSIAAHTRTMAPTEVSITLWKTEAPIIEKQTILLAADVAERASQLCTAYGMLLEERGAMPHRITVESITTTTLSHELLCSLSQLPFLPEDPIILKMQRMDALTRLIAAHCPAITRIIWLRHHASCTDAHLDFEKPWPIASFINAPLLAPRNLTASLPRLIVLDVGSTTRAAHRTIGEFSEYGIATQFALALKQELATLAPHIPVVVSDREEGPGAIPASMQNTWRICLSMCHTPQAALALRWYIGSDVPSGTTLPAAGAALHACMPIRDAHLMAFPVSTQLACAINAFMHTARPFPAVTHSEIICIPHRILLRCPTPAAACEIYLPHETAWKELVPSFARSIAHVLTPRTS